MSDDHTLNGGCWIARAELLHPALLEHSGRATEWQVLAESGRAALE